MRNCDKCGGPWKARYRRNQKPTHRCADCGRKKPERLPSAYDDKFTQMRARKTDVPD